MMHAISMTKTMNVALQVHEAVQSIIKPWVSMIHLLSKCYLSSLQYN